MSRCDKKRYNNGYDIYNFSPECPSFDNGNVMKFGVWITYKANHWSCPTCIDIGLITYHDHVRHMCHAGRDYVAES